MSDSTGADRSAGDARSLSPLGSMLQTRRGAKRVMTEQERQQVVDDVFIDADARTAYLWRFFVLLILSTLIATLGLVANSVAVIIGAMLLAPLMTPILAVAAALVIADVRALAASVAILMSGIALAVLTALIATWAGLGNLTVASALPSEILGRTQPSLLDLGVAVAAGLAAGYVITHRRVLSSLPGVAIAVALVPPLATVGITLELGQREAAQGAMLLFATNLVAIVLSAILMMRWAGFASPEVAERSRRSSRVGVAITFGLLVAIAVPLSVHTRDVIIEQSFAQAVGRQVAVLDPNAVILDLSTDVSLGNRADVSLTMATSSTDPPPAWELAEQLTAETGRVVDVEMRIEVEQRDAATAG